MIGDLKKFHLASDPKIMEEIKGIGFGFGINEDDLFLYLNSSLLTDYYTLSTITEGCTAFPVTDGKGKVFLGKNRDYRSDHISIQKVFLHSDPEWGKRKLLCIGSLGSPGNFSSGMNSECLVVADTASLVKNYGVGCHRYFLMTRLLVNCSNVQEALQAITSTKNAGGGNLVLADSQLRKRHLKLLACLLDLTPVQQLSLLPVAIVYVRMPVPAFYGCNPTVSGIHPEAHRG